MRVLYLSAWYPHRYDAMEGLFVRKHADASSRIAQVSVLFVKNAPQKEFELTENQFNNIHEYYVYYPEPQRPIVGKPLKTINWLRAYWKGFKWIKEKEGLPNLIHTNILTRTGFITLIISIFYNIPYIITEHWSRYLQGRNGYKSWLRKRITEIVVQHAKAILPVSKLLQEGMQNNGLQHNNYHIVNNVVDDFFFETPITNCQHSKTQFLHISCFCEEAKNVKGIIDAVNLLRERRNDFELTIIGTGVDYPTVYEYAASLNLLDSIHFIGEKTPIEVRSYFQQSDVFVLNSNYETSCVVIMESLASGKPVITTPVGIAPQVINESNGLFSSFNNPAHLADNMEWMILHHQQYDAQKIRETAHIFSQEAVSEEFKKIYDAAIN